MWNGIKIPQKNDGTALFWSVLTVEDGRRMPDGQWFHGKRRRWVEATQEGLREVQALAGSCEYQAVYFSQAYYWRPAKIHGKAGVACLTHCWVDLDCQNHVMGWADWGYEEKASFLCGEMMLAGLPLPSMIVSSGRGAYALWSLTEPFWNVSRKKSGRKPASVIEALNGQIVRALAHIGADAKCAEYGRVLRVPNSKNWKANGACCEVIHDSGLTYSVGDLKASVLPWSREQVLAHKKAKRTPPQARKRRGAPVIDLLAEREKRVAGFTQRKHAHRIIEDLRTLSDLRWSGEVPEGWRDVFGHLATSAIARYHRNPATLLDEVRRFTSDFLDDPDLEEHNSTSMKLLEQGRGYAYSIRTMRQLLHVTPYESARLFVLSSDEEKDARRARAERARREAKGAVTRDIWLAANNASRSKPWEALGVSRATYYRQIKAHEATQPNSKMA